MASQRSIHYKYHDLQYRLKIGYIDWAVKDFELILTNTNEKYDNDKQHSFWKKRVYKNERPANMQWY